MSIALMAGVWDLEELNQAETLILLALANCSNDDGVWCNANLEYLAHRSRQSIEAVSDSISRLKRDGWLIASESLFEHDEFLCLNVEKICNRGEVDR